MAEFYNPYQFISVTGKINGQHAKKTLYSQLAKTHVRHDYWDKESYSGRLVCKLSTETPTIVGAEQPPGTSEKLGEVKHYKDIRGDIAIPANSLRGMVSSTAETLSQSALRVLNQSAYSVRKDHKKGLSAIGYLFKKKDSFYIKPMCLPNMLIYQGLLQKWQKIFSTDDSLKEWLPVYLDKYETIKDKHTKQSRQTYQSGSFLDKEKPSSFIGKKGKTQYYYAKLNNELQNTSVFDIDNSLLNSPYLKIKNSKFLLGQFLQNEEDNLISASIYDGLNDVEKEKYTRGILYILGIDGREEQMPESKYHEKFIPCPTKHFPELKISDTVIDDFSVVSKQCMEASKNQDDAKQLPFLPKGYKEEKQAEGIDYWQPAAGELIYFDVDEQGAVSEISYSSIWRQKIKRDIYHSFKQINPDLLPWGNEHRKPETSRLTPAETLFGFVAEKKTDNGVQSYNLASRVKFSDAVAIEPVTLEPKEILLKILASPKPPSPAMYFGVQNGYIKKTGLELTKHKPNGRKIYLHHPEQSIKQKKWESKNSENLKQKLSCLPIAKEQTLYYHVDFNNLSWDELSLLIKAINPGPTFFHRIGLGKPLGLGSVKNEISGLFLIDRVMRYQSLENPRYTRIKIIDNWDDESLKELYPVEAASVKNKTADIEKPFNETLIDRNTLKTLITLGDRNAVGDTPVCYPYKSTERQQANQETEGFRWFGENDESNSPQVLGRVQAGKIPKLKSN